MNNSESPTFFAHTAFRNEHQPFGILSADRLSHMYIVGKTGTGKTTLLEALISQDISRGQGMCLIDPHGDLVERVAASLPEKERDRLVYFDVPNATQPYGYNPLKYVAPAYRPLAASGMLEVFKKMWVGAWGQRLEHILRNALLALLEHPTSTLADILQLLTDSSFRYQIACNLDNERVRDFWLKEFKGYSYRLRAEAIVPIQNKVGAFLADPTLNRILTAPQTPINIRRLMDEKKILLVNLSKGRLGDDTANLLGGLLVTTVGLAAFSRADLPEEERVPFFLYVDEFQNFTTQAIGDMASELRKYRVGLILANQYLQQLDTDIRNAVLGNAGTLISFRLSALDAAFIAKEFDPVFSPTDLLTLPNYNVYLKLLIEGTPSKPFSAKTMAPDDVGCYL